MPYLERARRTRSDPAPQTHLDPNHLEQGPSARATAFARRHWAAAWLGLHLLGTSAGAWVAQVRPEVPATPLGLPLALAAPLLLAWRSRTLPVLAALLVLGGTATWSADGAARLRSHPAAVAPDRWSPAHTRTWTGRAVLRVTGWPAPVRGDRWQAPTRLLAWRGEGPAPDGPRVGDGVRVRGGGEVPEPGAVLSGGLTVERPDGAAVPGGFDSRRYLAGRGLAWQGELADGGPAPADRAARWSAATKLPQLRAALQSRLDHLLPPPEAALANAILLGARSTASRDGAAPFARLGLAHLFAVSGLHVGVLLGLVLLPSRALGIGPFGRAAAVVGFAFAYALLTGLPGSVVRAAGMAVLAVLARPCGRRADPLHLLGLLFWCQVAWEPARALDTGARLSYAAAAGILVLAGGQGRSPRKSRWWHAPLAGLRVSFAAQWFTLPSVAGAFGAVSAWSLPANLVAVPVFGLAVWALALGLAGAFVWPPAGEALAALAWVLLRLLAAAATLLGRAADGTWGMPPPEPWHLAAWLGATAVLLAVGRVGRRTAWLAVFGWLVLPAVVLILWGPPGHRNPPGAVRAWHFAVGQGDCTLVRLPDGWTVLIDTGGRFGFQAPAEASPFVRDVQPFLARHGIRRLDAVVLTHGHLDHTGGAAALADRCGVGAWWCGGRAGEALADVGRRGPPGGPLDLHRSGPWRLRLFVPPAGVATHENDHSLVVTLERDGALAMVWSGDLEKGGEAALLAAGFPAGPALVWKAGHHGSATSGSAPWLERLAPALVVVSCGVDNRYGHPSHPPYLTAAGRRPVLVRTDLDGTIVLTWGPDGGVTWESQAGRGRLAGSP